MYAIVKIKGHQYKVKKGDSIEVDHLDQKEGEKIELKEVLLLVDKKTFLLGQPLVEGAKIVGKIEKNFKGKKIKIEKFRAKSRYRKKMGFRPQLTKIHIEEIIFPKKSH